MRKLTIYPSMGDSNMKHIESIIDSQLPENFKEFIKVNGGLSHYERYFIDAQKTQWEVKKYLTYVELFEITQEFLLVNKRRLIPFAFDPGGWHFCLCMDQGADKGKIIVNRWTDYLPEEQFLIITNDFDEFINGLQTEEQILT